MNEVKEFLFLIIWFYFYEKFLFYIANLYYSYKYCNKKKKGCTCWSCYSNFNCPYYKWNIYDEDLKSYRPMTKNERKEVKNK